MFLLEAYIFNKIVRKASYSLILSRRRGYINKYRRELRIYKKIQAKTKPPIKTIICRNLETSHTNINAHIGDASTNSPSNANNQKYLYRDPMMNCQTNNVNMITDKYPEGIRIDL